MDEKWRLALWAAAAAKDMEFAATQRSAIPFVEEGLTFFDKLKPPGSGRFSHCVFTCVFRGKTGQWCQALHGSR